MNVKQLALSFMGTAIRLVILAAAILAIYKAGLKAYDFGYRIFTEKPMSMAPGRDVAVTVVQGDSLMDIANLLEEKGLVRDAKLTYIQKKVSVYSEDIKPGFYTLNTSMTTEEMFAVMAGDVSEEVEEGDASDAADSSDTIEMSSDPFDEVAAPEAEEVEAAEAAEVEEETHGVIELEVEGADGAEQSESTED